MSVSNVGVVDPGDLVWQNARHMESAKQSSSHTTIGPQPPPHSFWGIVYRMGPGMIIAGSIVGSGELIATTSVGAESGFVLLWLILVGCAIKVFVQVELGRYTVTWSQTTLDALNQVPGPRLVVSWGHRSGERRMLGGNWILWAWAIMTLLVLTQQGGIVGGVGQAIAIRFPLTDYGRWYTEKQNELIGLQVAQAEAVGQQDGESSASRGFESSIENLTEEIDWEIQKQGGEPPRDSHYWATLVAVITSVLMLFGKYGVIQAVSTIFVGLFTLLTLITLCLLQSHVGWAVTWDELRSGLTFQLPAAVEGIHPTATAMATFGLIGVGAGELLMYPYWCLEKGYAQFTGPRSDDARWVERARGWTRVMQFDAWGSLVVYTFATATFYLLGAAVLWRVGLNPEGGEMVRTLSQMYVPVFGDWSATLFLFGAFAVLYSTFFVVTAGFSRLIADGLGVMGLVARDQRSMARSVSILSVLWPLLAVALYWWLSAPKAMVLASGVAQSLMLPVLGFAAIYFRYQRMDTRLRPSAIWDLGLWVSFFGLLVAGVCTLATKFVFGG